MPAQLAFKTFKIMPDEDAHFIRKFYFVIEKISWDNAGTYACSYDELNHKNNLIIKVREDTICKSGYKISKWSEWSECLGICGNATQARNRTVTETINNFSSKCDAPTYEHRDCNPQECKGQISISMCNNHIAM